LDQIKNKIQSIYKKGFNLKKKAKKKNLNKGEKQSINTNHFVFLYSGPIGLYLAKYCIKDGNSWIVDKEIKDQYFSICRLI